MTKNFTIPQPYNEAMEHLSTHFKEKGIWVRYVIFTSEHVAELKLADKEDYDKAMEEITHIDVENVQSIFGIENEREILVQFTGMGY